MMVAMMLPSAVPMILLYSRLARGARAQGAVLAPTSIFAGMYLAVWGGFSPLAALGQWLLVRSGTVSEMGLAFGNQRIGGALLIAAGLYQATPLKRACLDNCQSSMSFLMRLWRPGWGAQRVLASCTGSTVWDAARWRQARPGVSNFAMPWSNSDRPSGIHQDAFARFRKTISWARSTKARRLAAMWRRPG
jgi:hypothetical protein